MGLLIIFDHNSLGMCSVDFTVRARRFSMETKGHMCGTEREKERKREGG